MLNHQDTTIVDIAQDAYIDWIITVILSGTVLDNITIKSMFIFWLMDLFMLLL